MRTASFGVYKNWYGRSESHQECYGRRRLAFKRAVDGFAFEKRWLNSDIGLIHLLNHCKDTLREQEFLFGVPLNLLGNLIDSIDDIRVGKQRSLLWIQFIDSMIGQRHVPLGTPPSSAHAFLVTFLRFPLDSSEKGIFVYDFPNDYPWRILRPCNGDSLTMLEMVFRGLIDNP